LGKKTSGAKTTTITRNPHPMVGQGRCAMDVLTTILNGSQTTETIYCPSSTTRAHNASAGLRPGLMGVVFSFLVSGAMGLQGSNRTAGTTTLLASDIITYTSGQEATSLVRRGRPLADP
jgi:hypothetical protein